VSRIEGYLQSQEFEYDIFNSPGEAMAEQMDKKRFVIIQSGLNGGYAYGNNIGIRFALKQGAEYVMVLNNDTIVDSGFLDVLVRMCMLDQTIGIVSSKIYFYNNPEKIWFNGGKFHPHTGRVEQINFNERDIGQLSPPQNTFISGCAILVPKRVLEQVGLLNEEYFMYVEDLEFSQRTIEAGYKLSVCPSSKVWHKAGASSGGHLSQFMVYQMAKNKVRFFRSHLKLGRKLMALSILLFRDGIRFLLKGRFVILWAHLRGVWNGFGR